MPYSGIPYSALDSRYINVTGDTMTGGLTLQGAVTVETVNGIDVNPGSDTDTDLVTVGVDGTPILKWDESENAFDFNTIIALPTTSSTVGQIKQNGSQVFHTYGTNNLFVGPGSGNFTLTSVRNVGLGGSTLAALTDGEDNLGIGSLAMSNITGGDRNIGIGSTALLENLTGNDNMAIGSNALRNNTTGVQNVAIGPNALTANVDGNSNFAMGNSAMISNVSGDNCVAIGEAALQNSTVNDSVAVGASALLETTTGVSNVAIGNSAGKNNTGGAQNTIVGTQAGEGGSTNTKERNVMLGFKAGNATTSANNNIFVGWKAGDVITTGDANIVIGYNIDPSGATASNELNIGGVIYGTLTANQNITINAVTVSANYDLMLAGDGVLGLKETATPAADTNYGKVYCKNDDKLYFQDGAGAEHEVAFV